MVRKKKESKASSQKQKSRAKYQCPPELIELIRQTNLIPIGIWTPHFESEMQTEERRQKKEGNTVSLRISDYEFLRKTTSHLPQKFLKYIKNVALAKSSDEDSYKVNIVNEYIEYCDARNSLLWLINRLDLERQMMDENMKPYQLKDGSITLEIFIINSWNASRHSMPTTIKRDDDGNLQITGLAAIIGKFDDSRLRICAICELVFWAKREDSKTCSPGCLNKLNVRRHRALTDEEKAERKAKREANQELIKKGKAKPTKRKVKK